jgi:hypothetical protein
MSGLKYASVTRAGQAEQSKISDLEKSITSYLRLAGDQFNGVIPLPNITLTLSQLEARSFLYQYETEISFRAELAAIVRQMVSILGCVAVEMELYEQRSTTRYLWQKHADSLQQYGQIGAGLLDRAAVMLDRVSARGLVDKAAELEATRDRLQAVMEQAESLVSGRTQQKGDSAIPVIAGMQLWEA